MRYTEFSLNEGYKEVQQKFSQEADPTKVAAAFDVFKKLVSANRISGNERNIDWWGKQEWPAFIEYVTAIDERPSEAEQKSRKNKGTSHVLEETAEWLIVVPLDKDASCFHGKKSDWCTTKPNQSHFEHYFRDDSVTLIYFFRQSDGAMWAMAVYPFKGSQKVDYFDQRDKPMSSEEFNQQTGLNSKKYIQIVSGETEVGQKATASRDVMKADLKTLQDYIEKLEQMSAPRRSAKVETLLLKVKDSELIEQYFKILHSYSGSVEVDQQLQSLVAVSNSSTLRLLQRITAKTIKIIERTNADHYEEMKYIKYPTKQALEYITSRGALAVAYAIYIIKGQWPEGEAAIAQDGAAAASYATRVIGGPWPPGEAAIANNARAAYDYIKRILERRWPEAEAAIAQDGFFASVYAVDIINMKNSKQNKVRWPEGEAAIADDADASVRYATYIIQGRWPPGEAAIADDAEMAYIYATEILRTRFPAAEEMLSNYEYDEENEEDYWAEYQERFDL